MSLPKNLIETTEAHLRELVDGRVLEGPYLEFKRDLPGRDNGARHELAADVSAFANSTGGDVVYGVDEDDEGRASALVPQQGGPDEESRRIQDVLLNSVEPRIQGLQVHPVTIAGGMALVIRIPQSWAGPHRVRTNQHFFVRENGRKRQLDVPEVRSLFLRSEQQAERIRDFRSERLGKILAGEAPHPLVQGAVLVGHFIPTQAALGLVAVDPVPYFRGRLMPVLSQQIGGSRINADGALAIRNPRPEGTFGYSQMFRNGFFETTKVLQQHEANQRAILGAVEYEQQFIALLRNLRAEYIHLGIGSEMTVLVSILRAREVELGLHRWRHHMDQDQGVFDRDTLILPDVLLPADVEPEHALKPVFDLLWQAAGMEGSLNFDGDGNWAPIQQ